MKYVGPNGRNRSILFSAGVVALFTTLICQAARSELDLGGTWQYQKVSQLTYPPTNTWQTMTVPGFLDGYQYEKAWFRRVFTVPGSMAGTRLKLRFGGVKYAAQVWLNGTQVGSYLNGYDPFELDVTSAALVGASNELVVAVSDWTALFATNVNFGLKPADQNPRDFVRSNILAPIGGRYEQYGIWQPVKLASVPAVFIEDVFVMPSVRTQQLTVRLTLRNDAVSAQAVSVTNRVLDGAGATALSFPVTQITVQPNTSTQVTATLPWTNALWWTHLSPFLYHLETSVGAPTGQDQLRTRFGFREFWTQAGKLYLNGIPITLLASSTWPPSALQTTNQIMKVLSDVKNGNNVAIRFHTQPWDEPWYDMADELGILVVEEFAVWCDPWAYKLSDATFWTNYSKHVTAAIKRDRNHPSLVLWSLENEILHCGGERAYSATESQLAAIGRTVKALDPTRPITYEADLDPDGEAHVLGLHYPYEYPDYHLWPASAWWMDKPIARDWVPGGQWMWDHAKPLYVGEFGWVPATSAEDYTILFGDSAYLDSSYYRNQAKGLTWKMQIEAFRGYGVNAMCPWTMFEDPVVPWGVFDLSPSNNFLYQVQKAAYHPNGVYPEEYNARFFAGETATRTVRIYNDRLWTNSLTLRWRAGGGAWQSLAFSLPPAGQRRETISFQAPSAGSFALQFELSNSTNVLFTNAITCASLARPDLSWPAGAKLGLYDPRATTAGLLNRFGIPFLTVTNLRTAPYDQLQVLLVGRHALTNDSIPEVGRNTIGALWLNFARRGGWVINLEQTNYPSWMPGELRTEAYDASFAFPHPTHPVTAGISSEDLRWWASDHRLVANALVSPTRGNTRIVAGVGSAKGMEYAAALELLYDKGGIFCSQWLLNERFDAEPLAGLLLQRVLNYCAASAQGIRPQPSGLLAETNSPAAAKLAELGLQAENLTGRLGQANPGLHPVLVIAGGSNTWQEATSGLSLLTNYVDQGGRLLLHRPSSAFLAVAQPVLFPGLEVLDYPLSEVLSLQPAASSLQPEVRVANHDLHWIEQAGGWDRSEVLTTNLATRYYRKKFNLTSYSTIQAESMPIKTSGGADTGGWWLWSNGYLSQNINVAEGGAHLFNVLAKGTPVSGGWPRMSLRIDGRVQDAVFVATNQSAWFSMNAYVPAGLHELSILFDNDAYAPPEDRNLFVDQIRWGRDLDTSPLKVLTSPGAVAQVNRGAGTILLDEITWETETRNAAKAGRYASALLTDLGASLRHTLAMGIEAETMTNFNVDAYYVSGGIAYLNSGGRIQTRVSVSTAGTYTFEIYAGGTAAVGILPQIGVTVGGVTRTNFFLTSTNLSRYVVTLSLAAGTQDIGLAFLNDHYAPPEDRNANFDRFTISAAPSFSIVDFSIDAALHTTTLQWETEPGKSYAVQMAPSLNPPAWTSIATNTSLGSILSWQDTGALSGMPPLSLGAPARYYRVRQL